MSGLKLVKGMQDFVSEDALTFYKIVDDVRNLGLNYCYQDLMLPNLEYTDVFLRTLGDYSDIVNKEMYTFDDKKSRSLTLRPEFTASVVRSLISSGLVNKLPQKLFTYGPLFRYENPQKGRYRQFNQVNFEYIGVEQSYADAEVIELANEVLKHFNLSDIVLHINSLGDAESRKKYNQVVHEYFSKYENDLSEDSKNRLKKNPLRIFDSKDKEDQKIAQDAPVISSSLNQASKEFFEGLLGQLDALQIKYHVNEKLVRGLDYYNHTVFEFITNELGAQGTVLAGGRYDGLIKHMGGPQVPAVGFGCGVERIMLMLKQKYEYRRRVSIVLLDKSFINHAMVLMSRLRKHSIPVELEVSNKIQKAMKKTLENNSRFAIFIGADEIKAKRFKLKDLDKREEHELSEEEIIKKISL